MHNSTQALYIVNTGFEASVGGRLLLSFVGMVRPRLWLLAALLLPLLLTSVWMVVGSSVKTPPFQNAPELPQEGSEEWWSLVQQDMASREYYASTTSQGLQAPNRAHNWRIFFKPSGVEIIERTGSADSALLRLELAAWGRADQMQPAQPGTLFSQAERVEIRRGAVVEWYRNSAQGLEHGFEIARRPAGEGDLRFTLSATGALVELKDNHIIFTPSTGPSLRYDKLHVYDASGREVPAHFELLPSLSLAGEISVPVVGGRIQIVIDDTNATYPLLIDPLFSGTADATLESNQFGAGMGHSVAGAGDVNGDGYADVIVGAWRYDNGHEGEGAAFVYHGGANGISASPAITLESNQFGANLGVSVAGAGDVNGDGYADVIVGAWLYDNGQDGEGAAFVYQGGANGISASPAITLESNQFGARLGASVAGAGDINGDGYADVIVGTPVYTNGETNEGAAFVYHGGAEGISASPAITLESNQAEAEMGWSVAGAGDVNGDGYADVIVGAWRYDNGQDGEGVAFVYHGGPNGINSSPAITLESNQAYAHLGVSVAGAGDVNGDGYADVIVGANDYTNGESYEGAAFVYHGGVKGISASPAITLESNQAEANLGDNVAGAGDVNGDGYADVIVGAAWYGQYREGAAFIHHGGAVGISASPAINLESSQGSARLGISVAGAGDVNGDGYADVIVGADEYDNGQNDEGAAFVYHGGAFFQIWLPLIDRNWTPPPPAPSFTPKTDFTTGRNPPSVALGDVNGDGIPDLATANINENSISVLLNTTATGASTPSFTLKTDFTTGRSPASVALGDVNGDGLPDLVVANNGDNSVSVLLNTTATGASTPSFSPKTDFTTGGIPYSVAMGDVNGDGKPDLAVASFSDNNVAVLLNTTATGASAPSFSPKTDFTAGFSPYSITMGDVNGDGRPDLVVTNGTISILLNTTAPGASTPSYSPKTDFATGLGPVSVALGDVNGDGRPDLAVANAGDHSVSLLLNTTAPGASTPSFSPKADFATGFNPASVALGDVNGDGKPDLATANEGSNSVSVLLNTTATSASTPSFAPKTDFDTGRAPVSVALGDMNGDGKPDLAVANRTASSVSVLLNTTATFSRLGN